MGSPAERLSRPPPNAAVRRPRAPEAEEGFLRAATALFAREGYAHVMVPAVAAARVGLNTLYRRYPGKAAPGNAVYRRCKRAWVVATLDGWPADAPPARSRLRRRERGAEGRA